MAEPPAAGRAAAQRNEVMLAGRLAAAAVSRALPSGDEIMTFRLVVSRPRPAAPPPGPRMPTVDTIDCVVSRASVRRAAARWEPGDVVEVSGALRRRFWRGPAGPVSRCEVEVQRGRRLVKAAAAARGAAAAAATRVDGEAH